MIFQPEHNPTLSIAVGRNRKETRWQNKSVEWAWLLKKLSKTHRTSETVAEYAAMPKPMQDEKKDVGGFVGGYLTGGRRRKGSVLHRTLLTLDADYLKAGEAETLWSDFTLLSGAAACVYSTHKHTPSAPRLRLVVPLSREVNSDEYAAIGRRLAGDLNIEWFDPTTFEPERLMYWPSTSTDGEYMFEWQDGPELNVEEWLERYVDWKDVSEWPISARVDRVVRRSMQKQGEPTEKPGLVGAFCRTYDVHEAVEAFLSDVYTPCSGAAEGRYSYVLGSTAAGVVIYDDKFAYSHHGSDPAGGKLSNAFDLVRLHKFGLLDDDCDIDTPINKRPSYAAMTELAAKDKAVRRKVGEERLADFDDGYQFDPTGDGDVVIGDGVVEADLEGLLSGTGVKAKADIGKANGRSEKDTRGEDQEDSSEVSHHTDLGDTKWLETLEVDAKGNYKPTIDNIVIILENDPRLKGTVGWNSFARREVVTGRLPWRLKKRGSSDDLTDVDDAGFRHYIEKVYGMSTKDKVKDALSLVVRKHAFHPVRDYLDGLEGMWDGVPRVDRLFIDFLGAEDCKYTKVVTRKALVACVARIMVPGIKFDNVLTLVGRQGAGKSQILKRLGKEWYSDSLSGVGTKEAYELLQGAWVIEMAELAGLRKAEVDQIKHFISKTEDTFRAAYGRRTETSKRECVFFGTTNDTAGFLQDQTGNRRWWPLLVMVRENVLDVFKDMTPDYVDQVWAEAVELWGKGETLHLSAEEYRLAEQAQKEHTEIDERVGIIRAYLEMEVPSNWESMEIYERRAYVAAWRDESADPGDGGYVRDKICAAAVFNECFNNLNKEMTPYNTKFIHQIFLTFEDWKRVKSTHRFSLYGHQMYYQKM